MKRLKSKYQGRIDREWTNELGSSASSPLTKGEWTHLTVWSAVSCRFLMMSATNHWELSRSGDGHFFFWFFFFWFLSKINNKRTLKIRWFTVFEEEVVIVQRSASGIVEFIRKSSCVTSQATASCGQQSRRFFTRRTAAGCCCYQFQ